MTRTEEEGASERIESLDFSRQGYNLPKVESEPSWRDGSGPRFGKIMAVLAMGKSRLGYLTKLPLASASTLSMASSEVIDLLTT